MPSVKSNSDLLFWEIAIPVMVLIIPWSLWGDIKRLIRYMLKNQLLDRVEKRQDRKVRSAKRAERIRRRTLEKERNEKEKEREMNDKNGAGNANANANGLGLDTSVKG